MVITSENKTKAIRPYNNSHFKYALVYVLITTVVLLFLNYYCSKTSQLLFSKSKESAMTEKCQLAASEIAALDILNPSTVANAVEQMKTLKVNRLIVTDQYGKATYDTQSTEYTENQYMLFPEIVSALQGNDVFSSRYHDGVIQSHSAIPMYSYGVPIGCVYMMELDAERGAIIQSLQSNILIITLILEAFVIIFSVSFSNAISIRLRRILASMRIIREGDYSHKVRMGGWDELTMLGDEFNDLTDRLQTSERKRHQFVSDASHELKTPLASIKLLSDSILQNDMDMETVREFVDDIGNEADRLTRMTQKLLSLSRVDSLEGDNCEIAYMAPTVHRVVRMLSGLAEQNEISIYTDLQEDSSILILEDDLYQIIFNLVENGIKYTTPGGKVTISLLRQEDTALLQVSDTGVGIPEDAQGHVFERFYRVDKARSRKTGGSGLGLSIVRNMVERNGGSIQLTSVVGEGSTFTVSFPVFDTEVEQ